MCYYNAITVTQHVNNPQIICLTFCPLLFIEYGETEGIESTETEENVSPFAELKYTNCLMIKANVI